MLERIAGMLDFASGTERLIWITGGGGVVRRRVRRGLDLRGAWVEVDEGWLG